MPHFEHIIVPKIAEVKTEVLTDVVIDLRTISSRSGNGGGADVHTTCDIDPAEPMNMRYLLAVA